MIFNILITNVYTDLVAMSRIMDTKIRNAYVIEQAKIETIDAGAELNPLKDLAYVQFTYVFSAKKRDFLINRDDDFVHYIF